MRHHARHIDSGLTVCPAGFLSLLSQATTHSNILQMRHAWARLGRLLMHSKLRVYDKHYSRVCSKLAVSKH
jgi:hypothetical protein